jgi:hypothetical protein
MSRSQGRNQQALSLPDDLVRMLAAEDKRKGFPPGTMQALLQQEVGGHLQAYLTDPTKYHYEPNAQGRRIAHNGRESTAFGPFGIVESTARDPGYGVAPLRDKSLAEQLRFASDYLGARVKLAGSLEGGLAGYGEGPKYGREVARRIPGADGPPVFRNSRGQEVTPPSQAPARAQATAAAAPTAPIAPIAATAPEAPVQVSEVVPTANPDPMTAEAVAQAEAQAALPVVTAMGSAGNGSLPGAPGAAGAPVGAGPDAWVSFNQALLAKRQMQADAMAYDKGAQSLPYGMAMPALKVPDFAALSKYMPDDKPSFGIKRGRA